SALPPACRIVAAVACSGSLRRPVRTTVAPSLASAIAAAWPIPEPAPLTHATLPVNEAIECLPPNDPAPSYGEVSRRRFALRATSALPLRRRKTARPRHMNEEG